MMRNINQKLVIPLVTYINNLNNFERNPKMNPKDVKNNNKYFKKGVKL